MMYSVVNNPENVVLAHEITKLARAETWTHTMRTAAYGAGGLGILLICGAIASVIYVNGTAFAGQWVANAGTSFGRAISEALGNSKVELAKDSEVRIAKDSTVGITKNSEISVAKGGTVELATGGQVGVRQDSPLRVTGEITANIPRPTEAQMALTARPTSNAKVMTNITIFKTVDMPPGQVVTGWKFDDSTQERPSYQYCYFSQTFGEHTQTTIDIGENGTLTAAKRLPKGLNAAAIFQNCVWDK